MRARPHRQTANTCRISRNDASRRRHDAGRRAPPAGPTRTFAQLICEAMGQARQTIVAVSKSPRLPQVASFWATLTDRLGAGVTYRRVVDLDEVIAHGLKIVRRDIEEHGIDVMVLERDRIHQKFYVVDGSFLAVFHSQEQVMEGGQGHRGGADHHARHDPQKVYEALSTICERRDTGPLCTAPHGDGRRGASPVRERTAGKRRRGLGGVARSLWNVLAFTGDARMVESRQG